MQQDFDLTVIGGGSGGYGAALAAARRGLKVLLAEAGPLLGGNSTLGGVNTWEPGICGPGLSAELYHNLQQRPGEIGLSATTHFYSPDMPWGLSEVQPHLTYAQSLRRSNTAPRDWVRVTFEPEALAREMQALLMTAGVQVALGTRFVGARVSADRITSLHFTSAKGDWSAASALVVDASASLSVARDVGCHTALGEEAQSTYREPSAPLTPSPRLNGVSLCFRIGPAKSAGVQQLPPEAAGAPRPVPISITEYPGGDLNLNPLPIMEGHEYVQRLEAEGYLAVRRECEHRVRRLWHWLQTEKGFAKWQLLQIFPMNGVREGHRLVGQYVLTERDVRAGKQAQNFSAAIALADHALDIHGSGHLTKELEAPYGVPYQCLLPREILNLAVACRGASFSHLAASSCRLSRTMMDLGHAAGLAAHLALESHSTFSEVSVPALRSLLTSENVLLQENF